MNRSCWLVKLCCFRATFNHPGKSELLILRLAYAVDGNMLTCTSESHCRHLQRHHNHRVRCVCCRNDQTRFGSSFHGSRFYVALEVIQRSWIWGETRSIKTTTNKMNGTSSSLTEKEADILELDCCSSSRMRLSHEASVELRWWQPTPAFLEMSLEIGTRFSVHARHGFLGTQGKLRPPLQPQKLFSQRQ